MSARFGIQQEIHFGYTVYQSYYSNSADSKSTEGELIANGITCIRHQIV